MDHQTITTYKPTDLPTDLNKSIGIEVREKYGLSATSYDRADVESIVSVILANNPAMTRSMLIDEFFNTAKWQFWDVCGYLFSSTRTFVAMLKFKRAAAMRNIEIFDGAAYVSEFRDDATTYQSIAYVSTNNVTTLASSDWALITINTTEIGIGDFRDMRIAETTDHVLIFDNVNASGVGYIHIISKTNLDTIAKTTKAITSFDRVVSVPLGSSSASLGFGSGGSNSSSTQGNGFVDTLGNDAYFTIKSENGSSPYPCIMRVDATNGNLTTIATSQNIRTRVLNVTSFDTMNVGSESDVFRIESLSTEIIVNLEDADVILDEIT